MVLRISKYSFLVDGQYLMVGAESTGDGSRVVIYGNPRSEDDTMTRWAEVGSIPLSENYRLEDLVSIRFRVASALWRQLRQGEADLQEIVREVEMEYTRELTEV